MPISQDNTTYIGHQRSRRWLIIVGEFATALNLFISQESSHLRLQANEPTPYSHPS
jgi:hypothetical protein